MARKQSLTGKRSGSIKPERARKLINKFHALNKRRKLCAETHNIAECQKIDAELAKLGGLKTYQQASICGQSGSRGGDSSKILMEWLSPNFRGTLLEVGCLQVDNYCARSNQFSIHDRIDLNSQHPKIKQQDFMLMSVPKTPYSVISLSLVVNYVPDVPTRGQMFIRAHQFLEVNGLLFVVLPRACIDNSRYCNAKLMQKLWAGVGFSEVEVKKSAKLIYWLLKKTGSGEPGFKLPKSKVRDGPQMNNFSIIV